jgi:FMN phosphatase YigB (HAD superfamily)
VKFVIFDLDATVIDSSHRQLARADGSLDLAAWRKNSTYSKVMRDSLLPLASHWARIQKMTNVFIAICTARVMSDADLDYLKFKGLKASEIMSRSVTDNRPDHVMKKGKILKFLREHNIKNLSNVTFYDDNQTVLEMLLDLGINAKDSIKINQELSK